MSSPTAHIDIADRRSAFERAAVPMRLMRRALAATVALLLIGLGVAWKATMDVRALQARNRALEIEIANYRVANHALAGQTGDLPSTPALPEPARPELTTRTPVVRGSLVPSVPPASPSGGAPQPRSSPATASAPSATPGGRALETEAAERQAFQAALARMSRTRVLAEAANAPATASQPYQEGVALELEAQQFSIAGRMAEAVARVAAAEARFHAAEVEARAEGATVESLGVAEALTPVRAPVTEAPEPAAIPSDPSGGEPLQSGQPPESQTPGATAAEGSIQTVIAQYVSGLESQDLAALKHVWPSLSGNQERAIRTEFENARTVQVRFNNPRVIISGDETTVTGDRNYNLVMQDGQRLSRTTRTTLTLRRSGAAWVIDRVAHQ
jgi:hypothetical protein